MEGKLHHGPDSFNRWSDYGSAKGRKRKKQTHRPLHDMSFLYLTSGGESSLQMQWGAARPDATALSGVGPACAQAAAETFLKSGASPVACVAGASPVLHHCGRIPSFAGLSGSALPGGAAPRRTPSARRTRGRASHPCAKEGQAFVLPCEIRCRVLLHGVAEDEDGAEARIEDTRDLRPFLSKVYRS